MALNQDSDDDKMSESDEFDIEYTPKNKIIKGQFVTEGTFHNMTKSEELRCIWSEEATSSLIELYKKYALLVGKSPNCKSQKGLWHCICNKLQDRGFYYTPDQVCNKWKVLKRTYRAILNNKRKHGSVHQDELEEVLGKEIRKSSSTTPLEENSLLNDAEAIKTMNIEEVTFVDVPQILNTDEWSENDNNKSTLTKNAKVNGSSNETETKKWKNQNSSLLIIKRQMDLHHKERMAAMKERNLILEKRNKLKSEELALQREKEKHRHEEKMTLLRLLKDYLHKDETVE